jgi:benzil reductase ((S)-benzoin forming)
MAASARKLAIVTGTTSGVGAAVAADLLDREWDVLGIARRSSTISHHRYRHLRLDLADLSSMTTVLERDVASSLSDGGWARIGLVNNAASPDLLLPMERLDALELSTLFSVNAVAPMWMMGFVSRHAPKNVPLRVVNVSSGAAVRAFGGLGAYGSAKAALRMAGMILAEEWQSRVPHAPTRGDAAIMNYQPAAVDTPMQEIARSKPPEEFPWVGMFTSMRDRGVLVKPEGPAAEIADFLDAVNLPSFSERRFGEPA